MADAISFWFEDMVVGGTSNLPSVGTTCKITFRLQIVPGHDRGTLRVACRK
jgi:hypothetical protein